MRGFDPRANQGKRQITAVITVSQDNIEFIAFLAGEPVMFTKALQQLPGQDEGVVLNNSIKLALEKPLSSPPPPSCYDARIHLALVSMERNQKCSS